MARHVALLQIQGKDFHMEPIPLRTVRPFVIDDVCLMEAAEDDDFDVTDQIVVGKFLRGKARVCYQALTTLELISLCTGERAH